MGSICVDDSAFVRRTHHRPDAREWGLWTFHIEEHDVCFWGRYPEAVTTAKLYANTHGVETGTITLVDCMNMLCGTTKH